MLNRVRPLNFIITTEAISNVRIECTLFYKVSIISKFLNMIWLIIYRGFKHDCIPLNNSSYFKTVISGQEYKSKRNRK